jgi:flavorubredoxin
MNRVYWLNPGDSIRVGDRKLTAVRPPLFDNPTTIGVYDDKSKAFFSADCFGAIIPTPVQSTDDVAEGDLVQGMAGWASLDNPWVHLVKPSEFSQVLDRIRQIAPKVILSAHLPPATGKTDKFLELLATVPPSTPSIAPNQTALEQILAHKGDGS